MARTKMLQKIAFLIVMSAAYVKSIRNAVSPDGEKSSDSSSSPMLTFPDSVATRQQQSFSAFRPTHLLDFTVSDVLDSAANIKTSKGNIYETSTQSLIAENTYDDRTHLPPDASFSFPNNYDYEHHHNFHRKAQLEQKQQQRQHQLAPSNEQFNEYDTAHTSPKEISKEKYQFQSAPTVTRLDLNTDGHYSGPEENVAEYTVHSSMQVQNPHTVTYQRNPPPTLPSPPAHLVYPLDTPTTPTSHQRFLEGSQASEFSYNYNNLRPSHSQHPNGIPDYTNRKLLRLDTLPTSPARLSYVSKGYPPPSYFQHSNNHVKPQRQDYSPALTLTSSASSTSSPSSLTIPNYSNSYQNNYLHSTVLYGSQQQEQQRKPSDQNYYHTRLYSPSLGMEAGAGPNYYPEYQLGEIPPSDMHRIRPPLSSFGAVRPILESPQETSPTASLASLFTTTQQQTPQFSNLGNLIGTFNRAEAISPSRPINAQLVHALENIARNDDLRCVPKVLCQLIAGQTQRGQLPSFVTSPAITNFLAAFPAYSPALIFGRAVLLGISGGVTSCVETYAKCPKREDEILYYLNNHRGGFFKLFNETEPKPQTPEQSSTSPLQSSSTSSLFNILSSLAGEAFPTLTTSRLTKTKTKPASVGANITNNIANFFTNLLSTYVNGIDYQRRRRRVKRSIDNAVGGSKEIKEEAIGDEKNDDDKNNPQYLGVQSRILHKNLPIVETSGPNFFPQTENLSQFPSHFSQRKESKKSKFIDVKNGPRRERQEGAEDLFSNLLSSRITSGTLIFNLENTNRVRFRDDDNNQGQDQNGEYSNLASIVVTDPKRGVRMIYTGDINELMHRGRILNGHIRVTDYDSFVKASENINKLVVSDTKRLPHPRPIPSDDLALQVHDQGDRPWLSHNNKNKNIGYISPGNCQSTYQGYRTPSLHSPEEDKNIYVTNAKGLNEYYITPEGKRVYT